jgi:putative membrane protein
MTIIERIDNAATRAQLAAMGTLRDAAQRLQGPRDDTSARGTRDPVEGATTGEYAIGTIAAAGFAGLLIVILKSDAVRAALESVIQEALNTR